ncbi:unannotated protein [freshwater metagenome]|uniref:Unannotated protein n=1 Tax=freshwater metagenome TaxID=449393 RepID=A0A6J7J126_9ZZZZ
MRMDEIEPPLRMGRLDSHDAGRHRAELTGQIGLEQAFVRPGRDVANEDARGELNRGRKLGRGGPREDLDGRACGGEALGGFDDVDVHASRIAGAGLIERRGVDGEHSDPVGFRRTSNALRCHTAPHFRVQTGPVA